MYCQTRPDLILFKYFDNSSQIKYSEFLGEAGVIIMANHDALIFCMVFDYVEKP